MPKTEKQSGESFFSRLFSKFLKNADPEIEKKRLLRNIAKNISRTKYKFLKTNSQEATPQMAKFFYDIYKVIAPAQAMVRAIQNPNALKNAVITYKMSNQQREIYEELSEENILEMSKNLPFNQLEEKIKKDIQILCSEFDSEKVQDINSTYQKMENFKNFCSFDYFFFLKKFDSKLRESSFNTPPNFDSIRGEYVVEDLKDFLDLINQMQFDGNWAEVFKIFKEYRGVEPVSVGVWNKILSRLRDMKNQELFESIIRLILQDPFYTQKTETKQSDFVESYIDKIKTQTTATLQKIAQQNKNNKVEELAKVLFGSSDVARLKNYSASANVQFERKMLAGYLYYQPLNYMKAFLTDYFKKDVREFADLILVRGTWTTSALAKQVSDVYNSILSVSDQINSFDDSLGENSERGAKIKGLIVRSDKDVEANKIIKTQLRDINDMALKLLTMGSQNLVQFARSIKAILEDKEKSSPQMIINWKELEHFSEEPVRTVGVAIYKQIYQFVNLMQIFLKK